MHSHQAGVVMQKLCVNQWDLPVLWLPCLSGTSGTGFWSDKDLVIPQATHWVIDSTTMKALNHSMCIYRESYESVTVLSVVFLLCRFQLGSFCIRNIIIGTTGQFSSPEELTEVNVLLYLELIYILQGNLEMHQYFNMLLVLAMSTTLVLVMIICHKIYHCAVLWS